MTPPPRQALIRMAEEVVRQCLERLPPDIREAANDCEITLEFMDESRSIEPDLDPELLGLFEGLSRMDPEPSSPDQRPRIRIFADNIWLESGGFEKLYRAEIRITFLHELGHYLGWDEDEVEAAGLG